MKPETIKAMDEVLNLPWTKSICPDCGNIQTHGLRWCKRDGKEFFKIPDCTYLQAIRFAMNIPAVKEKLHLTSLRPYFIANIEVRKICEKSGEDVSELIIAELTQYIESKI